MEKRAAECWSVIWKKIALLLLLTVTINGGGDACTSSMHARDDAPQLRSARFVIDAGDHRAENKLSLRPLTNVLVA